MRTLYVGNLNASTWSMRAWLALREKGVSFQRKLVDLVSPARGEELSRLAPNARVPVLVDDGTVVFDSLAIMEYANDAFPGPELWPADARARARARSFLAWMHSGFAAVRAGMSFETTFYRVKPTPPDEALAEAKALVSTWDAELARTQGPYLFGGLCLADLAFVPVLRRFHAYNVALTPRVESWRDELMSRPAVQEWMSEAVTLPPFQYPA
jgi:glutathione S-transferase